MLLYSMHIGKTGWFVDNGAVCYGPYKREDKALAAAESLNRQARQRAATAAPRGDTGSATTANA